MDFYLQAIQKEDGIREDFKKSKLRGMKMHGSQVKKLPNKDEISTALVQNSGEKYIQRVVRLEDRDNRGFYQMKKDFMQKGFLLLGSSYTQAADPNSMRDFGPARNVIYNMAPLSDHSSDLSKLTYQSDSQNSNLQRYQTPQKSNIKSRQQGQKDNIDKDLESLYSEKNKFQTIKNPYDKWHSVVKSKDYTKNISDFIFSAGLVPPLSEHKQKKEFNERQQFSQVFKTPQKENDKMSQTQSLRMKIQLIDKISSNSQKLSAAKQKQQSVKESQKLIKESQRYLNLKTELKSEKERKKQIMEELKQMKLEMQSRLALVNMKLSDKSTLKAKN